MGERAPSVYSLYSNLYRARNTLFRWVLPERLEPFYSGLSVVIVVAFVFILALIVRNKLYVNANVPMLFLLSVFSVVYSGFLIVSSTTTAYDPIGDRLLAPIYPVLVVLALFVLRMLLKRIPRLGTQHRAQYLVAGVIAAWAILPVYRTIQYIESGVENGYGYTSKTWQSSETLAELERTTACSERVIYSNRSDVLYWQILRHTQPPEKHSMPQKNWQIISKRSDGRTPLQRVWYGSKAHEAIYSLLKNYLQSQTFLHFSRLMMAQFIGLHFHRIHKNQAG